MKLRGLRTINIRCIILFCISLFFAVLIIFVFSVIHIFIGYNNFVRSYPFSTVPFWKDLRVTGKKTLVPTYNTQNITLSNSSIVITACCRNVRKYLAGFRRNINLITSLFGNYHIYFCESDSQDRTLEYLLEWQKNDSAHVRIITKGHQRWNIFSRTARIAACRNELLQQARQELSSFDYYFVVDVDVGSSSSFDVKDFLSNFAYESDSWIAMTATQRAEYYDIWALRVEEVIPFDCWLRIHEVTSFFIDNSYLTKRIIEIHQPPIPRNTSLIEVISAFGGAALYNAKYLHPNCSYSGKNVNGLWWNKEQCEHVSFHECLQQHTNRKKIYINPQFQIC